MASLYITWALPNPAGKDRTLNNQAANDQLNGEWVQFENVANQMLSLEGIWLFQLTFDARCSPQRESAVTSFSGSLGAGRAIRVHTGSGTGWWEGAVFHFYLGRQNFVWNNACGDRVHLKNSQNQTIDWAAYAPHPAEGQMLRRIPGTNTLQ